MRGAPGGTHEGDGVTHEEGPSLRGGTLLMSGFPGLLFNSSHHVMTSGSGLFHGYRSKRPRGETKTSRVRTRVNTCTSISHTCNMYQIAIDLYTTNHHTTNHSRTQRRGGGEQQKPRAKEITFLSLLLLIIGCTNITTDNQYALSGAYPGSSNRGGVEPELFIAVGKGGG